MKLGATETLAQFAANLRVEDIPVEVLHQGERVILDTCCCAIAGYALDHGKKLTHVLQAMGGTPEATIFPTGFKGPAAAAAFVNTQLSNAHDLDDNLLYSTHFANTSVLPAFAVAESRHAPGHELVAAVIAAFEVTARIMLSMPSFLKAEPENKLVWRSPSGNSYNVFGAAVGPGRVLRLSPDQMTQSMGIAGYSATIPTVGKAFVGPHFSDMKYVAYGWMAWSGVLAALLAADGFTGDERVLEGPEGFWKMVGAEYCDFDMLTRDLGSKWWILDTSLKPYPAGTWMRNSMLALDRIVLGENLAGDEIEKIVVSTFLIKATGPAALTELRSYHDTQVSYPYLLAVRALRVPPNRWHTPEVFRDPAVLRTMQKIELIPNQASVDVIAEEMKSWHGRTRKAPATVEVHARGQVYRESTDYAKGDPFEAETRLTDDELVAKFRLFTHEIIRNDHVEQAAELLLNIASAKDVADIARVLTP